jgi:iron complex transport system permease protein
MVSAEKLNIVSHLIRNLLLFIFTILILVICLMTGTVEFSISDLWNVFTQNSSDSVLNQIIYDIRLPRILLAFAVGGGLSVAGGVFQALLKNPLAEPYILGISSGGAFGAIAAILLGLSLALIQLFSFAGAVGVIFLVFVLGRRFGEIEPNVLLLSGVMVGAFFSSLILLSMTILGDSLRGAIFWLIGNLSIAKGNSVYYVFPIVIFTSLILILNSQKYNVVTLGEQTAKHLGINTSLLKNGSYVLASFMIGSIVSVSGIIGFVGLLVPHVCRMLFGTDNRIILPASFFIGASYLMIADTFARTLISPSEIPVGAITALIGAPVFIYLLRSRFHYISK